MAYAYINDENVCFCVSTDNLINEYSTVLIGDYDNGFCGGLYENGTLYKVETLPEIIPTPQPTNQELQDFQLTMMTAMADQYEQNLANQLTTMEVQATIYESILELGGTTV